MTPIDLILGIVMILVGGTICLYAWALWEAWEPIVAVFIACVAAASCFITAAHLLGCI